MMLSPTACPSCGAGGTRPIGPIPASDVFAGVRLQRPLPGGELLECTECSLLFRWPRLPKGQLDDLYRAGRPHQWSQDSAARVDWRIIGNWLLSHVPPDARILDVGCSDGSFLSSLPIALEKFGVEVQPEAAAIATSRDVAILGTDFAALSGREETFQVVTAIDVVEHVEAPLRFLELLSGHVAPGGAVILSSGNTAALSWKIMRSRYWYCTIPEHISFINPAWCAGAAERADLRVEATVRFSHGRRRLRQRMVECMKNLFYRTAPSAAATLRSAGFGRRHTGGLAELAFHPPRWDSAKDHFVTIFRKTRAA